MGSAEVIRRLMRKFAVMPEGPLLPALSVRELAYACRVTITEKHFVTNRDRFGHAAAQARSASSQKGRPERIHMMSQAEIGLVKIDENIADADRYIRELGSLVPLLAEKGYRTTEIEEILTMLWQALHRLQVHRRAIVEMMDGDGLPSRIAQPAKRTRR